MHSGAFVELALKTLSCNQKELARRIKVSDAQITKWKQDEYMSDEMEKKFRSLLKIGDKYPEFVLWAGSVADADKWEDLILFLARRAADEEENGFDCSHILDEPDMMCWETFHTLRNMGVDFPETFPAELDINYEPEDEDDENWRKATDAVADALSENPYSSLIRGIFQAYTNVYAFYAAYISELSVDSDDSELYDADLEIFSCLLDLAATKLEHSPEYLSQLPEGKKRKKKATKEAGGLTHGLALAKNFKGFCDRTNEAYVKRLSFMKEKAVKAGVPLRAELLDMVYISYDNDLGREAERESFGINKRRQHPDIYMNELLVGMRAIHQALPAIMEKLGISGVVIDAPFTA